jgi:DNA-binding transcriptional LysR family regulator
LTKSIQRLEDELGGPLLLRERSLTQLTRLGRSVLPLLQQTYDAAQRAKEHAARLMRATSSPLRARPMRGSHRPWADAVRHAAAQVRCRRAS